jgi:hypothetical protein
MVPLYALWGNFLANASEVLGNPLAICYRRSEGIENSLAKSYIVSEYIGNPLTNSSEDIKNFCKLQFFFVSGLRILPDPLCEKVVITL